MELSSLETASIHEAGAEVTILHPVTREATDFKIRVMGMDSKAWRKEKKRLERQILSRAASGEEIDTDELEIDALVNATLGWSGLVKEGKPVKFSKKVCKQLYTEAPTVRDQVDRFIGNRANFTKG